MHIQQLTGVETGGLYPMRMGGYAVVAATMLQSGSVLMCKSIGVVKRKPTPEFVQLQHLLDWQAQAAKLQFTIGHPTINPHKSPT